MELVTSAGQSSKSHALKSVVDLEVSTNPSPLDQAGRHARGNNALKELPKDITLSKAVQPVLRKRGVMRNLVVKIKPTTVTSGCAIMLGWSPPGMW
jgi:hypothetical protein